MDTRRRHHGPIHPTSDSQTTRLLREVRDHDHDHSALAALVSRHYGFIEREVRHLRSRRGGMHDTADFAQEVALELVEYLPDNVSRLAIEDGPSFRRVLRRIISNTLHDFEMHALAARRRGDLTALRLDDDRARFDPEDAASPSPERRASERERAHRLRLALVLLDPEDQQLILRRMVAGEEFESIGRDLALTANAARMRLSRARERLGERYRFVARSGVDDLVAALRALEAPETGSA